MPSDLSTAAADVASGGLDAGAAFAACVERADAADNANTFVSVASGAAWAALGSDTGGSTRIPAALQGLVGFKSTQALTPLAGTVLTLGLAVEQASTAAREG